MGREIKAIDSVHSSKIADDREDLRLASLAMNLRKHNLVIVEKRARNEYLDTEVSSNHKHWRTSGQVFIEPYVKPLENPADSIEMIVRNASSIFIVKT